MHLNRINSKQVSLPISSFVAGLGRIPHKNPNFVKIKRQTLLRVDRGPKVPRVDLSIGVFLEKHKPSPDPQPLAVPRNFNGRIHIKERLAKPARLTSRRTHQKPVFISSHFY